MKEFLPISYPSAQVMAYKNWHYWLPCCGVMYGFPAIRKHGLQKVLREPCLAIGTDFSEGRAILGLVMWVGLLYPLLIMLPPNDSPEFSEVQNKVNHEWFDSKHRISEELPEWCRFICFNLFGLQWCQITPGFIFQHLVLWANLFGKAFSVIAAFMFPACFPAFLFSDRELALEGEDLDRELESPIQQILSLTAEDIQKGTYELRNENGETTGISVTLEAAFHWSCSLRVMDGLAVKTFLLMFDMVMDLNTIKALILGQKYHIAFTLTCVVVRSLLKQIFVGHLLNVRKALLDSCRRGVMSQELVDIFAEEQGGEAFFSLCVTCFAYMYIVQTSQQAVTQLVSIALGLYSVSVRLYQTLDLGESKANQLPPKVSLSLNQGEPVPPKSFVVAEPCSAKSCCV